LGIQIGEYPNEFDAGYEETVGNFFHVKVHNEKSLKPIP
jgi:hypothetical protein